MMKKLLLLASLLVLPPVQAETLPDLGNENPQITIRRGEEKTYYEYRVGGKIREIKVVPQVGKPYYLVPVEGTNDEFNRFENSSLLIPKWVIFSW